MVKMSTTLVQPRHFFDKKKFHNIFNLKIFIFLAVPRTRTLRCCRAPTGRHCSPTEGRLTRRIDAGAKAMQKQPCATIKRKEKKEEAAASNAAAAMQKAKMWVWEGNCCSAQPCDRKIYGRRQQRSTAPSAHSAFLLPQHFFGQPATEEGQACGAGGRAQALGVPWMVRGPARRRPVRSNGR